MQRAKGRKVSQVLDRLARRANRRSLAIFTSSRNHVLRVKIARTAMIRRSLASTRRMEKAKGAANGDPNRPQTKIKSTSHVWLGQKDIANSVRIVIEDMMNIYSTPHPQRIQQHQVQTPALMHGFDSDNEDEPRMARVASSQARKKVTIRSVRVDRIMYEKPDYVKCTKTQPRPRCTTRSGSLLMRFAKMTSGHIHADWHRAAPRQWLSIEE